MGQAVEKERLKKMTSSVHMIGLSVLFEPSMCRQDGIIRLSAQTLFRRRKMWRWPQVLEGYSLDYIIPLIYCFSQAKSIMVYSVILDWSCKRSWMMGIWYTVVSSKETSYFSRSWIEISSVECIEDNYEIMSEGGEKMDVFAIAFRCIRKEWVIDIAMIKWHIIYFREQWK